MDTLRKLTKQNENARVQLTFTYIFTSGISISSIELNWCECRHSVHEIYESFMNIFVLAFTGY